LILWLHERQESRMPFSAGLLALAILFCIIGYAKAKERNTR